MNDHDQDRFRLPQIPQLFTVNKAKSKSQIKAFSMYIGGKTV